MSTRDNATIFLGSDTRGDYAKFTLPGPDEGVSPYVEIEGRKYEFDYCYTNRLRVRFLGFFRRTVVTTTYYYRPAGTFSRPYALEV